MSSWERFNNRSENYDHYRPRYPSKLIDLLRNEADLTSNSIVADIGSGTGLLAELLLKSECKLFCVEPNGEMRNRAHEKLGKVTNCSIINGTAENTSLPASSIDLITAGQAFHWFDPTESSKEFTRILKRGGNVALVWNTRVKSDSGMNFEYEKLVKGYSKDYHSSGVRGIEKDIIIGFYNADFRYFKLRNYQKLNLDGLLGRYLSSSYALSEKEPGFGVLKRDFENAFIRNETGGHVTLEYETEVFIGKIGK